MEEKKKTGFLDIFNQKGAFYFGAFLILLGIQNPAYLMPGIATIFSAIACRSAQKRTSDPSILKLIIELVLIGLIVLAVVFRDRVLIYEDPLPNLIIPAWAIIAYVVKVSRQKSTNSRVEVPAK